MKTCLIKNSNLSSCSAGMWLVPIILNVGIYALCSLDAAAAVSSNPLSKPDIAKQAAVSDTLAKLPLSFELNRGQTNAQVKFLSRDNGYSLFLTPKEAVLELRTPEGGQEKAKRGESQSSTAKEVNSKALNTTQTAVLRMRLVGANSAPEVVGEEELPGKSNYLHGNDPKKWLTNIPQYAKARYKSVYPGIDLVYYGNQRNLEYDFVVAPGADPRTIRQSFHGANKLNLDKEGNLILHTNGGEIVQYAPRVYQEVDGKRQDINVTYELIGQNEVSFQVDAYDVKKSLIIDPVLRYSTYLGGNGEDLANGIAVDFRGNAYVSGFTNSPDFPTTDSLQPSGSNIDVFVVKLNRAGNAFIYSTYLGGSEDERTGGIPARGIAVDQRGNAYITGHTNSPDFPTANPLQPYLLGGFDAFVAKLNSTGDRLIYSTFLGGSGEDTGLSIAIDRKGNTYVGGKTDSVDLPMVNPFQAELGGDSSDDAFVAKLNPAGNQLIYSTYLGGSGDEDISSIAVDRRGNLYATGTTDSNDFPTFKALQSESKGNEDTFVTQLNQAGNALVYSTYLGGSSSDFSGGIAVDIEGNAYVTGGTGSNDFPTVKALQPSLRGRTDAFIAKLDRQGRKLIYSTYLGGSEGDGSDDGNDIAIDRSNNIYITGSTTSTNFPTVNAVQPSFGGAPDTFVDAFVTKLNRRGNAIVFSTYLGGKGEERGLAIAVDLWGSIYVAGGVDQAGIPDLPDFPIVNAVQPNFGGNMDAFVTKISSNAPPCKRCK